MQIIKPKEKNKIYIDTGKLKGKAILLGAILLMIVGVFGLISISGNNNLAFLPWSTPK